MQSPRSQGTMTPKQSRNVDAQGATNISFFDTFINLVIEPYSATVNPNYIDIVRDALLHPERFESQKSAGRGNIYLFPLEEHQGIVREYRRGGLIGLILKKHYFLDNRPIRELEVWCHAYEYDVPVPVPLGVMWQVHWPFVSGTIATQYFPSKHLQEFLESKPQADKRKSALLKTGKAIRKMHAAEIVHADLQVRNILVEPTGVVSLIDFDNSKIVYGIRDRARHRNLLRLKRSFEKNDLDPNDFNTICEGYGIDSLPKGLSLLYQIKGKISSALAGSKSDTDIT